MIADIYIVIKQRNTMKTVTIQILASDILENNYTNPSCCAMTKAFKRAGLDFVEGGGRIRRDKPDEYIMDTPDELDRKVSAMYAYVDRAGADAYKIGDEIMPVTPLEPTDFYFELSIPE